MNTLSRFITGQFMLSTLSAARPLRNLAVLLVFLSVGLSQSSFASSSSYHESSDDSGEYEDSAHDDHFDGDHSAGHNEWSDGAETHHADSDGDGYTDDEEITDGSDPYDHDSKPLSAFTEMVEVMPGVLPTASQLAGQSVGEFYIGKYEVVWAEWKSVRDWAVANGYSDLGKVGEGSADDHPVRSVSFYDALKWCNALSEKEGLVPVYMAGGDIYRVGQTIPVVNSSANGYRLPTEAEWEWAARGGSFGKGYRFSGSDDLNAAGWNTQNARGALEDLSAGLGTWAAGLKTPNELGLYDMTGNVSEWCFEANSISADRPSRGGSWDDGEAASDLATRSTVPMVKRIPQAGFRLVKNDTEGGHHEAGHGIDSLDRQNIQKSAMSLTSSDSSGHDASSDSDHSSGHDSNHDRNNHESDNYHRSSSSHSESSHDNHGDDNRSEKKNRSKKYKNDDRSSNGQKSYSKGSDDGYSKKKSGSKKSKREYWRSGDDKNYSASEGGDDNSKKKNRSKKKSRSKKSNS